MHIQFYEKLSAIVKKAEDHLPVYSQENVLRLSSLVLEARKDKVELYFT